MSDAQTASRILAMIESLYVSPHDYAPAALAQFPHLDHRFYERAQAALEGEGFRHVHDLEDCTVTRAGGVLKPVLVRGLVSQDGRIMAAAYHPKLKWVMGALLTVLRKNPPPVLDFETEHDDGSFTVTSNAAFASAVDLPALIRAEYLAPGTPLDVVLARHRARLAQGSQPAPRVVHDSAGVLAAQHRMEALKAAYRNQIGGVTREELDRFWPLGRNGANAAVHDEIQRQRA